MCQPFGSGKQNHLCKFGRGHYWEHSCEIVKQIKPVFQVVQEMSFFKIYFILSSGDHFVQQSRSLCNFGRGHYTEHFCEIILKIDQWFRSRYHLKIFLILSSFGQWSGTIRAILVEGILRNIFMKLF